MSTLDPSVATARLEFYELAGPDDDFIAYGREHRLELGLIGGFCGAFGVVTVQDCGNGRFDFAAPDHQDGFRAFVCEAFAADGETVVDLVAWPLNRPDHVMSMFGRCGMLGLWEAMSPATFFM